MSTNADAMVRAGVDAYKAGKKAEARTMLERAIELDGYNETAWLWLSAVVESKEEQQTCLENVLVINPENDRARQGLKSLGIDPEQVLNQANDAAEEEYTVPSSSASVEHSGGQATTEQYDDWVDGLNIGTKDDNAGGDDLFGDVDFSDDGGAFDIDDNIFSEDTFSEYEDAVDESDYIDDSLYDDDDYIDDGIFDDDPVIDDGDDMFADIGTLEDFGDAVGDVIDDYDDSQFMDDPFAPPPPVESKKSGEKSKSGKPGKKEARPVLTTEELYASIPKNIELTRPPGVSESVSSVHYAIIGILALVNIGAIVFIGLQFVG